MIRQRVTISFCCVAFNVPEVCDKPAFHKEYNTDLIPDIRKRHKYFDIEDKKYIVDHIIYHLKKLLFFTKL